MSCHVRRIKRLFISPIRARGCSKRKARVAELSYGGELPPETDDSLLVLRAFIS